MPIVGSALMPHGTQAIEELGDPQYPRFAPVADGLKAVSRRLRQYPATTAVIITPHGIRAEGMVSVSVSETTKGVLTGDEGETLGETYPINIPLGLEIASAIESRGLGVARLAYGASSGWHCQLPLDWGAQVPLHFLSCPNLSTVIVTPSRSISFDALFSAGQALAAKLSHYPDPIWLIASGDLAHTHDAMGPYGFHPEAESFDQKFLEVLKHRDWPQLLKWDRTQLDEVKPDAPWQMALVAGALPRHTQVQVINYACPTYFGMASCVFSWGDPA